MCAYIFWQTSNSIGSSCRRIHFKIWKHVRSVKDGMEYKLNLQPWAFNGAVRRCANCVLATKPGTVEMEMYVDCDQQLVNTLDRSMEDKGDKGDLPRRCDRGPSSLKWLAFLARGFVRGGWERVRRGSWVMKKKKNNARAGRRRWSSTAKPR